ncbi:unnamed protein product [Leptidea sinapis]|uniref:Acyltransferase 3 domain-containing protein n=1 Tax=Leptidea sinapis TaxID=189913 RepID=A0A5E4QAP2_9NEOP|nr:unnamed protein product [Leptidea sinapis]
MPRFILKRRDNEYSSQSLKHYNRSQIHRGVCVSRCDGNTSDWRAAAEKCVNETVQQYGLEAELLNATWCSTVGESRNSQSSQVLWVVVILLLVLTLLATGLHILGDKCGRCDGNKYLMAFSLKKNWHILNYDRSKPRHDARMKDLACLEGMRLTPVAIFALWFTIAWYPQLGSGPQWAWIVDREAHDCSERWWYHVLYVHNHIPLGKFCMGHTWYLAVDMQLHIIGILVLLLLMRYPFLTSAVLAFLLLATTVAAGCVTYLYQLSPIITAQSPEDLRTFFLNSSILPKLYLPSWMNMSGYVCGMATAFIHSHYKKAAIKLNQKKISLLITTSVVTYLLCIPICLIVELPMVQLWKAVFESLEPVHPTEDHAPTSPKFDLVASIRRNQVNCQA